MVGKLQLDLSHNHIYLMLSEFISYNKYHDDIILGWKEISGVYKIIFMNGKLPWNTK